MVDAEVVDGDEDDEPRQSVGGILMGALAPPGPQPRNWGAVPQNQWSGVGHIGDSGNLPNVIVSNTTGETTYTSASALLAK